MNFLSGPGRGVILIKLGKDEDQVLGFLASTGDRDLLTVETTAHPKSPGTTVLSGPFSLKSS